MCKVMSFRLVNLDSFLKMCVNIRACLSLARKMLLQTVNEGKETSLTSAGVRWRKGNCVGVIVLQRMACKLREK